MPKLHIPGPYRAGADKLARLPDAAMEELRIALQEEPPTVRPDVFISSVTAKLRSIPPSDSSDIIDTLIALYTVRSFLELSIAEFAEGISQSEDLEISADNRDAFAVHLRTLLGLESLAITSKAFAVWNESERGFHDARIVTDVRPIFEDDATGAPVAAIVIHTLRVRYHRSYDRQLEDFFVTLAATDIPKLRAVLDRADAKAKSLEATLAVADIPNLAGEPR